MSYENGNNDSTRLCSDLVNPSILGSSIRKIEKFQIFFTHTYKALQPFNA